MEWKCGDRERAEMERRRQGEAGRQGQSSQESGVGSQETEKTGGQAGGRSDRRGERGSGKRTKREGENRYRRDAPTEAKKPLQDQSGVEAPGTPQASGHCAPRSPSPPQEPLSPNPTPRPGNWNCSEAKLFGKQRLCNHMNSHSLSYLLPASGFPPLANRTDQSSGAGREGGGPSKGVENIRIRAIAKGLGFPPLL